MRILTAMTKHETNTFFPVAIDLARSEAWRLKRGESAAAACRGAATPVVLLDHADSSFCATR